MENSNISKTTSSFQKRINLHKKRIDKLMISIEEKNYAIRLMNAFINRLKDDGRITKEEMVEAIQSKKLGRKVVKEHRLKYNAQPKSK